MISRESLSAYIKSRKKPVSFRVMSKEFCTTKKESSSLKKMLRQMVRDGDIAVTPGGLYDKKHESAIATGYFEANREGYGFVVLETPGERDVFIPQRKTMGAMDADRVIAVIENPLRRDGRIVKILQRAHANVVGRLMCNKGRYYVQPKKRSIPFTIDIPKLKKDKVKEGDTVIVEIKQYDSDDAPAVGKILKVLEVADAPVSEIDSIVEEFGLPKRFAATVSEEARQLPHHITPDIIAQRHDLRILNTVTIDGEKAKDFDDAISIVKTPDGYRLYVHIADVSHFVPWESNIDVEARRRGTSVYLPDRVIPMLPKRLSEELCSLRPKRDRLAFTVEMAFTAEGQCTGVSCYTSVINSNERMTYTDVSRMLNDGDKALRQRYSYLLGDFELMEELCAALRRRRMKRGSLDFDLPEPEVIIDILGNLEGIVSVRRNPAHMLIEEFMIAANEAVARRIADAGVPSLYRIHEEPDQRKMIDIIKVARHLISVGKQRLSPRDMPRLIGKACGGPYEELINYLVLRSLKQARYSVTNVGHFGLASECYTHFTSPIRRYPDLVVHRVLRDVIANKRLSDKKLKAFEAALGDIAFHSSARERIADDVERETLKALRAWLMKGMVGKTLEGSIVGVNAGGLKVRLNDYFVDGFLDISAMIGDSYVYDEADLSIKGIRTKKRFFFGGKLSVRISGVDMQEREVFFAM
ncbi:MAG: ribonuclease R [Nitrospirae bacterium]|uniref:ribonuclease R n=1 Tax=Candidatus Magnetobacterium casense TaxID=1455061 RepID=UPI00059168D4